MIEPPSLPPAVATAPGWQPLPRRGAPLAAVGAGIGAMLPLALAGGVLALLVRTPGWLPAALGAAAVGLLAGAWIGWRRHRLTRWRLDEQAFAVRHGHLWQSESHVPVSRVQHLDLRRGPLQRAIGLATLVVHTAGTRMNTVALAGLDQHDAERLRDRLARQLDHDDDAL
ncbi:PH domain-containing protein [Stenotrophomonas mori]|uniref:PH domain-containing protein n=1 Tax=Stenotrophomonas mori TaxID=2871096 RepID=A0ABT0SJC3_9GAMM|nr:PH domain-containing protein [Stenotrophomonas mori]MCL7715422.1 PH domain-containing protein [Stenotrophomonas mori]